MLVQMSCQCLYIDSEAKKVNGLWMLKCLQITLT